MRVSDALAANKCYHDNRQPPSPSTSLPSGVLEVGFLVVRAVSTSLVIVIMPFFYGFVRGFFQSCVCYYAIFLRYSYKTGDEELQEEAAPSRRYDTMTSPDGSDDERKGTLRKAAETGLRVACRRDDSGRTRGRRWRMVKMAAVRRACTCVCGRSAVQKSINKT